MSSSTVATICEDFAAGFDEVRKELYGPQAKVVLLVEDQALGKGAFKPNPKVITRGWLPDYSEFYVRLTISIADLSPEVNMAIGKSTHLVIIHSTNEIANNVLFEISQDTTPPVGSLPYHKVRCKSTGARYQPQI